MAYQPAPGTRRPRNPHTHAQIRRDTWLQIVAPLVLATLVLIVLMVLIISPSGAQTVRNRSQSPASRHTAQFSTSSRIRRRSSI